MLEKTGKFVKGKYTLTGGSVGLFEGKKIGRAKNLEKLAEDITDQESVVNLLKSDKYANAVYFHPNHGLTFGAGQIFK